MTTPSKYFTLNYDFVDGFAEKRLPFREAHLQLIRDAHARGELIMAGSLGDPPGAALLIFRAPDSSVPEAFARDDPYRTKGLVTGWRVTPWNVVIGGDASK